MLVEERESFGHLRGQLGAMEPQGNRSVLPDQH